MTIDDPAAATAPPGLPTRLVSGLDALVASGDLSEEQRRLILAAVQTPSEETELAPPRGVVEAAGTEAEHPHHRLRDLVIEAAAYVGAALIVASGIVLVAQNWEDLSIGARFAILLAATVVALGAALTISTRIQGGRATILTPTQAPRCRLAGVLFVAGALAAGGCVVVLLPEDSLWFPLAMLLGLAVTIVGYALAPSWITGLAMVFASFMLVQTLFTEWLNSRPYADTYFYDDALIAQRARDERWGMLGLVLLGTLWTAVISPRLAARLPVLAGGAVLTLMGSFALLGTDRAFGLVAAALLAGLGFWRYLREGLWPWLVLAVAELTAFVFVLVGGANRPALAFLVAGTVLLASSAVGFWMRSHRRTRTPSTSPAAAAGSGPGTEAR